MRITFKTPDAVEDALANLRFEDAVKVAEAKAVLDKFIKHGEYITIEFDLKTGTANVIPTGV